MCAFGFLEDAHRCQLAHRLDLRRRLGLALDLRDLHLRGLLLLLLLPQELEVRGRDGFPRKLDPCG